MKLLFVFCFCFVGLLCANDSYAQRTMISVKAQNLTVKEVLSQIEAQSDFSFFYNDHHIDVDRRVSVVTEQSNIFTLLNEVFKNTNVKYAVRNKKIILSTQIVEAPAAKQTVQIKGKVTDMFGGPVIGATVMEDGTQNGTITDLDGNFILNTASANVTITVSYVGYMSQTVKAQPGKSLSVILKEDTKTLDEIVVVGFGTQKKVNLTGSVSTVNAEDLLSRPVSNVSQALQGLVPGMNFSYASDGNGGEIGADMKVNIRGAGTIGDGSNASPLILIDGMEGNMNMLNPNDIESISVLKDAAASSIYGSRAPFGVVLITTKKGKAGKVNINYNNSFRWSEAINLPDVTDAYTYAMYFNKMQLMMVKQRCSLMIPVFRLSKITHRAQLPLRPNRTEIPLLSGTGSVIRIQTGMTWCSEVRHSRRNILSASAEERKNTVLFLRQLYGTGRNDGYPS